MRHYQHTCQLEGLLDDDTLWRATMVDGVGTMRQLRDPFVMLLLYSGVGDPRALWNEFRDDMTADYARQRGDKAGLNELDPEGDEGDYNCALTQRAGGRSRQPRPAPRQLWPPSVRQYN